MVGMSFGGGAVLELGGAADREVLRDLGEFAELEGAELSAGNPQPCHKGFLVWCEVKETVPFEAEEILLVRCLVGRGVIEQHGVRIERMQLLLHSLLEDEVVEREGLFRLWRRLDVAETLPARRDSSEETREIIGLLSRQGLPGNAVDRNRAAHGQ